MRVEFYKHSLGDEEIEELRRTLDSLFLAYGPRTIDLECGEIRGRDLPKAASACAVIVEGRA